MSLVTVSSHSPDKVTRGCAPPKQGSKLRKRHKIQETGNLNQKKAEHSGRAVKGQGQGHAAERRGLSGGREGAKDSARAEGPSDTGTLWKTILRDY